MACKATWSSGACSDVGKVRSVNQDSCLCDDDLGLFIVADGMGGHAGGEIASDLCVKTVHGMLQTKHNPSTDGHPHREVFATHDQAINKACLAIYERSLEEPVLRGMGTTATMLQIVGCHAYGAHVGDSRFYLLRQGFIYQISTDHSLVSEQVRAGRLTLEEAKKHRLKNIITRCVGYQEKEFVDVFSFPLESGDFILLCSDGLHGRVSDKEISLTVAHDGIAAAKNLIAAANANGGDDNITAVLVRINSLGEQNEATANRPHPR